MKKILTGVALFMGITLATSATSLGAENRLAEYNPTNEIAYSVSAQVDATKPAPFFGIPCDASIYVY